ncbi:MAG: DNA polymerase IV [Candidatus Aminicenantes bacterium]|nr:DNA polymerase IV [Candidatus Aminicenantes bacterium]
MILTTRCIVHIDIDAFFASVEKLLDPSLEGKPVIVGGLPYERGVASTASYEARKYGVHSGMSLQKAYQLCPHGIFVRGNHRVYAAFSKGFHKILSRYTPDIEMASLDEAYLDLSRCRALYSCFSKASQQIKQTIEKELKLSVSVGIGANKILAKLATNQAKPGGLVHIKPGHEESFLKELSIASLPGIGPKAQAVLHLLNIRQIKDLWGLPRATLRALFGLKGEEIRLQSHGIDDRPLESSDRQKSISRETTFLKDIWEKRLLLAHLAYLCDRLSLALRKDRLFSHIIELKVRWSDFKTEGRRRLLVNPVQEMDDIYRIARELFSELFQGARLSLRLVGVKASDLVRSRTLSLFESYSPHKERLGSAVSEVRERYGFAAVLTAREKMLEEVYRSTKERGFVLKTASLTK